MSGNSWKNDSTLDSTKTLSKPALPLLVLVGKPNVGKSTLFNRLIGKRKAITHSKAGVTRDPVQGIWKYKEKEASLLDTGGIRFGNVEELEDLARKRSVQSLQEADGIIVLTSIEGLTAEDEELFTFLRPYSEKIILVVNKVDTEARETLLGEFYGLGFGEPIPISATHGRNCEELTEYVFTWLEQRGRFIGEGTTLGKDEEADLTLAVLGKPNTGKSTLVNTLLGREVSIVSALPGTTRDVVEDSFVFKDYRVRVLDTAGIRRKSKVQEDIEYYSVHRAIESIREAEVVLLLLDAEEELSEQDKKIAAQVVKKGRGIILGLNKWDRVKGGKKVFREREDRIRFQFPVLDFAPILPLSAKTGWNVDRVLSTAFELKKQLQKRIETSALNKALEKWIEKNPPPQIGKKKYKVRYLTQVRTSPLKFVMFVNRSEDFPDFYLRYLQNQLREEFHLSSVPLHIDLRSRGSS
ncbi:MAG: ribosome biogenesis GTPase Der [Spirochaetales bacterium]